MAQRVEIKSIGEEVELLTTYGIEEQPNEAAVLLNSAILAECREYMGAGPYERSARPGNYANRVQDKVLKTRLESLLQQVTPTRFNEFDPRRLNKSCAWNVV